MQKRIRGQSDFLSGCIPVWTVVMTQSKGAEKTQFSMFENIQTDFKCLGRIGTRDRATCDLMRLISPPPSPIVDISRPPSQFQPQ